MKSELHQRGDTKCNHEECKYLMGRGGSLYYCACGGLINASETDWSEYSFGHHGGLVFFETFCDACGEISRDPAMVEKTTNAIILFVGDRPSKRHRKTLSAGAR